jgi:hypothetical protein
MLSRIKLSALILAAILIAIASIVLPLLAQIPSSASPQLRFRESDQTLPAGLWRLRLNGNTFTLEQNTAAAGVFSTLVTPISIAPTTGNITTLGSLTVGGGLTANSFQYPGTGGLLSSTSAATDGQLLIGRTGLAPVAGTITGTANQIIVTNGAGTITLNTTDIDVYKPSDESVVSSAVSQADDHLLATLASSSTYSFKFFLLITNTSSAEGFRCAVSGTATINALRAQVSIYDGQTDAIVTIARRQTLTTDTTAVLSASFEHHAVIEGSIETNAGGTFGLIWAQNVSGVNTATVQRGSYLVMKKIG